DPENPGETGAIEMATQVCVDRGEDNTLVIPADIPLIQPWELEEIYKQAPTEGTVLVPAGDGRGTNAAFRRPANLFPLRFTDDSSEGAEACSARRQPRVRGAPRVSPGGAEEAGPALPCLRRSPHPCHP